jgi:hypothetical protein
MTNATTGGPPPTEKPAPTPGNRLSATHTTSPNYTDVSCPVCALRDQACTCAFYADWYLIWPTTPDESIGVQLRRRRDAALRAPRLACGRRDPISTGWR